MTIPHRADAAFFDAHPVGSAMPDGPRVDEYHRRELGDQGWLTCRGCPSLRVFDFHYFYCRRLGDQSKPDAWNAGWHRLWDGVVWNDERPVPCNLPAHLKEPTP